MVVSSLASEKLPRSEKPFLSKGDRWSHVVITARRVFWGNNQMHQPKISTPISISQHIESIAVAMPC